MYHRILVPLDGLKLSEEVLPLVRELAEMSKGEVILLRIAEYPYSSFSSIHTRYDTSHDLKQMAVA